MKATVVFALLALMLASVLVPAQAAWALTNTDLVKTPYKQSVASDAEAIGNLYAFASSFANADKYGLSGGATADAVDH